jgi:toxin ParE1/3/4
MNSNLTTEQQAALNANDGIVDAGDVVFMRVDVFRDMLGFATDEELRQQLQVGFDQADRGQLVEWDAAKLKAEGRRRLQQRSEISWRREFASPEQAEEDVLEIWEYIASDNLNAADRLVDRFEATYQKLAQTPGMGVKQEQFRAGLRCFPVGKYIIFYTVTDDELVIYRVLHGSRRLEDLL